MGIECSYCWQITSLSEYNARSFDLHEIILSRGAVMKSGDLGLQAIMSEYNCGWIHRDGCHQLGEGGDGRMRGIMYLLRYEGFTPVWEWLLSLQLTEVLSADITSFKQDVLRARDEMESLCKETQWQTIWDKSKNIPSYR